MSEEPPRYLILPGFGNSGPEHWQSLWEASHGAFVRLDQSDWDHPNLESWVHNLELAVSRYPSGLFLVAHSLGCLLVAHWAAASSLVHRIRGALLVGVPDPSAAIFPPEISGFSVTPQARLGFPSLLVASTNDPFVSVETSRLLAGRWGARLVVAGPMGHLNADAGLGSWEEGRVLLEELETPADDPVAIVGRQFEAYNAHDLDGWAATYAPDAVQSQGPGTELAKGREAIRVRMSSRFDDPNLRARLVSRTPFDRWVIDQEVVTRTLAEGVSHYHLSATYEVKHGLIQSAVFVFGDAQPGPEPIIPTVTRWAVIFTDTPQMLSIRREREALHLDYLESHRSEIRVAGGLRPVPGAPFVGGLWVLETATRDRAIQLIEQDPYFVPECRTYAIYAWGKALDGAVVL